MKKNIVYLLALLSFVMSFNTFAACSSLACSGLIKRLYINQQDDSIYIEFDGVENLSCQPVSETYLVLKKEAANFDEMFSLALSAEIAEKRIAARVVQGSNPCRIQYLYTY